MTNNLYIWESLRRLRRFETISAHKQDLVPKEFTYESEKADADYNRYLQRRGLTAEEHEREVGEWLDVQD